MKQKAIDFKPIKSPSCRRARRHDVVKKEIIYNPLKGIIKTSPFDEGISATKAIKISKILGYKSGTIHVARNKKFHPCIDNYDFQMRYFKLMKEKMPFFLKKGGFIINFN